MKSLAIVGTQFLAPPLWSVPTPWSCLGLSGDQPPSWSDLGAPGPSHLTSTQKILITGCPKGLGSPCFRNQELLPQMRPHPITQEVTRISGAQFLIYATKSLTQNWQRMESALLEQWEKLSRPRPGGGCGRWDEHSSEGTRAKGLGLYPLGSPRNLPFGQAAQFSELQFFYLQTRELC